MNKLYIFICLLLTVSLSASSQEDRLGCTDFNLPDTIFVEIEATAELQKVCLPISFNDFLNSSVTIDGEAYDELPFICDFDSVGGYDFTVPIWEGAYVDGNTSVLISWTVNGDSIVNNQEFSSLGELTNIMNATMSGGIWSLKGGDKIEHTPVNQDQYGALRILSPSTSTLSVINYNLNIFGNGTEIELVEGLHEVIIIDSIDCDPEVTTISVERLAVPTNANSLTLKEFVIYPNPVTDYFKIDFGGAHIGELVRVALYDLIGNVKYSQDIVVSESTTSISLENQFSSGVHIFKIEGNRIRETRRILIK